MADQDHRDLLRRLMAGGFGVVCDIEGAVHVHLTEDHDPDAARTADVLLDVMDVRTRQRDEMDDDIDDELWMWKKRLSSYRDRLARYVDHMSVSDRSAARSELICLAADVVAHAESIDPQDDR